MGERDNDILESLSNYIDEGYVVQCSCEHDTKEVLRHLEKLEYKLSSYTSRLLEGSQKYDSGYPNVGMYIDNDVIDCWSDWQTSHPTIRYSDILNDSHMVAYETDVDFEDNLRMLLS